MLGECIYFLLMIFVSHYMFIIFLWVLMSLDMSVPTVLSDNKHFVESIFCSIFYLPGAGISDFLLCSFEESLWLSICSVSKYSTSIRFITSTLPVVLVISAWTERFFVVTWAVIIYKHIMPIINSFKHLKFCFLIKLTNPLIITK